jgi:hypothetical protein
MRKIVWLASAVAVALLLGESGLAQAQGRRGGRGGRDGQRGGPRGGVRDGLERAINQLDLSSANQETVRAAVRTYRDNVSRLTDMASAGLVLKLKDVVSPEEFATLRKAAETARTSTVAQQGRGRGGLGADAMVERLLSFDKNKDGKLTKDELPERMQDLVAKGDTNKDGSLDKEEIQKLAADLARDQGGRGFGRGGRGGRGGQAGPGGRGGRGGFGGPGGPGGRGGFAGRPDDSRLTLSAVERAVRGLNLSGTKKEAAAAAVKACQENVRSLRQVARADLLLRVSGVLTTDQFGKFKEAVER